MEKFSEKATWFMPLAKSEWLSTSQKSTFPADRELLSSGRDALFRILKIEKFSAPRTLWLPEYFCPSVARSLKKFIDVKTYIDLPSEPSPRFETLSPKKNDAVLCVDFFGLRNALIWNDFFAKNKCLLRIDDASHAPFKPDLKNSNADYVFASLRKTLPLPDGAYLWKKNSKPSDIFLKGGEASSFAVDMLSAACAQNAFGYDVRAESLYFSAENKLDSKTSVSRISKYSLEVLQNLDLEKIAQKTVENLIAFLSKFPDSSKCTELNRKFANTTTAANIFCPILKFANLKLRDKCHNALFEIGVMPSIYWGGLGKDVSESAQIERDTTLAIPIDFRHSKRDAEHIGKFLSKICADF